MLCFLFFFVFVIDQPLNTKFFNWLANNSTCSIERNNLHLHVWQLHCHPHLSLFRLQVINEKQKIKMKMIKWRKMMRNLFCFFSKFFIIRKISEKYWKYNWVTKYFPYKIIIHWSYCNYSYLLFCIWYQV